MPIISSKCKYDAFNKQYDNVGFWCWIWIILSIIIHLIIFIVFINNILIDIKENNKKRLLRNILTLIINVNIFIIQIYFIYSMCKLCRAWTAFIILLIVSCFVHSINYNIQKL
jgi:hypothetical protein